MDRLYSPLARALCSVQRQALSALGKIDWLVWVNSAFSTFRSDHSIGDLSGRVQHDEMIASAERREVAALLRTSAFRVAVDVHMLTSATSKCLAEPGSLSNDRKPSKTRHCDLVTYRLRPAQARLPVETIGHSYCAAWMLISQASTVKFRAMKMERHQ